jgi:2-polyprenyl-6-methoxyphenol hydroxylase-like FAD-dependent oxidoreductase
LALHLKGAHVYELTRAPCRAYAKDGVVLIGDAAHCTNPTGGQGIAMALATPALWQNGLGRNGEMIHSSWTLWWT